MLHSTPLATAASQSHVLASPNATDGWTWLQRVSWGVSIAGVTIAIIQLGFVLKQQRRIARDLEKRPDIDIGFLPFQNFNGKKYLLKEKVLTVSWSTSLLSNPIETVFVFWNKGPVSARHVLLNVCLTKTFDHMVQQPQPHNTKVFPFDEGIIAEMSDAHIHPNDWLRMIVNLTVPKSLKNVDVKAEVSMDDRPSIVQTLRLVFQEGKGERLPLDHDSLDLVDESE